MRIVERLHFVSNGVCALIGSCFALKIECDLALVEAPRNSIEPGMVLKNEV